MPIYGFACHNSPLAPPFFAYQKNGFGKKLHIDPNGNTACACSVQCRATEPEALAGYGAVDDGFGLGSLNKPVKGDNPESE